MHNCDRCEADCDCETIPCSHLCLQLADDVETFSISIRLPQRARGLLLRLVGLTDMSLRSEVTDADVQQCMCGLLLAGLEQLDKSLADEIQLLNEDTTRDLTVLPAGK